MEILRIYRLKDRSEHDHIVPILLELNQHFELIRFVYYYFGFQKIYVLVQFYNWE